MHSNDELFRCRVCGLLLNEEPWGADGNSPTYSFCPCCGVEFGYGDALPVAAQRWRAKWLAAGAEWDQADSEPADWSAEEQLLQVPQGFGDEVEESS